MLKKIWRKITGQQAYDDWMLAFEAELKRNPPKSAWQDYQQYLQQQDQRDNNGA